MQINREGDERDSLIIGMRFTIGRGEKSCCRAVGIEFKAKRGEMVVIGRKQEMRVGRRKRRGSKKVKMPKIEFDLQAIKEIKGRKKRSKKKG
jgi:hypothetical protein